MKDMSLTLLLIIGWIIVGVVMTVVMKFGLPIFLAVSAIVTLSITIPQQIDPWSQNGVSCALLIISCIVLVLLATCWPVYYGSSGKDMARLETFYNYNNDLYNYAIDITEEVKVAAVTPGLDTEEPKAQLLDIGLLAYQQQANKVSDRIGDWLRGATRYNTMREKYIFYNEFLITRGFVKSGFKDLKLITVPE